MSKKRAIPPAWVASEILAHRPYVDPRDGGWSVYNPDTSVHVMDYLTRFPEGLAWTRANEWRLHEQPVFAAYIARMQPRPLPHRVHLSNAALRAATKYDSTPAALAAKFAADQEADAAEAAKATEAAEAAQAADAAKSAEAAKAAAPRHKKPAAAPSAAVSPSRRGGKSVGAAAANAAAASAAATSTAAASAAAATAAAASASLARTAAASAAAAAAAPSGDRRRGGATQVSSLFAELPPDAMFSCAAAAPKTALEDLSPAWAILASEASGNCLFSSLALWVCILRALRLPFDDAALDGAATSLDVDWSNPLTMAMMAALRAKAVELWRESMDSDAGALFPADDVDVAPHGSVESFLQSEASTFPVEERNAAWLKERKALWRKKGKEYGGKAGFADFLRDHPFDAWVKEHPLPPVSAEDYLAAIGEEGAYGSSNEVAVLARALGISVAVVAEMDFGGGSADYAVYQLFNPGRPQCAWLYNRGKHFQPLLPLQMVQALRDARVAVRGLKKFL